MSKSNSRVDYPDFFRGETVVSRTFSMAEDGSPVDLTGATIVAHFSSPSGSFSKDLTDGIVMVDAAGGSFRLEAFEIEQVDRWRYDVQVERSDGFIQTIVWGYIRILADA